MYRTQLVLAVGWGGGGEAAGTISFENKKSSLLRTLGRAIHFFSYEKGVFSLIVGAPNPPNLPGIS